MADEAVTNSEAEASPRRSSVGGRIAKWLIGIVAVLGVLVAALLFGLNTPVGKRWVVEQIANIKPESGLRIKIGRIEGNILSLIHISEPTRPY